MLKLSAVVIALCLLGSLSYAQYDPEALKVLNAMSEKYRKTPTYSASFNYKLENIQEGIDEEFVGNVKVKGDMYFINLGGQEIYNNGEAVFTFLKEINEVTIDHYNAEEAEFTPSQIYDMYKKGYKYVLSNTEQLNGSAHFVIDLEPEKPKDMIFKVRLFIDQSNYSVSKWIMFDKASNRFIYELRDFKAITLSESFFTFDPSKYEGIEVVDLR